MICVEGCVRRLWADSKWAQQKGESGVCQSLVLALHDLILDEAMEFVAQHSLGVKYHCKCGPKHTYRNRSKCKWDMLLNIRDHAQHHVKYL